MYGWWVGTPVVAEHIASATSMLEIPLSPNRTQEFLCFVLFFE